MSTLFLFSSLHTSRMCATWILWYCRKRRTEMHNYNFVRRAIRTPSLWPHFAHPGLHFDLCTKACNSSWLYTVSLGIIVELWTFVCCSHNSKQGHLEFKHPEAMMTSLQTWLLDFFSSDYFDQHFIIASKMSGWVFQHVHFHDGLWRCFNRFILISYSFSFEGLDSVIGYCCI